MNIKEILLNGGSVKFSYKEKEEDRKTMANKSGRVMPDYADQNGETGNEMVDEYSILSSKAGSYTFKEDDDPKLWNVRIISKDHPKYDKSIAKSGKQFGSMMNMMSKLFGENF